MTAQSTRTSEPWESLDHAPAPGATLRRVLGMQDMSQRDLARRTGLTPKHVNQLLSGTVPLSAEVAERLSLVTGVPALFWNRLEADHRTVQMRAQRQRDLEAEHAWVNALPIKELINRGELPPEPADQSSRARQLLAYFGVASPAAWREMWLRPNAALRQSTAFEANQGAVATWIRLGENKARAIPAAPFDTAGLRELIPELRAMTRLDPDKALSQAREALANVGVAVVIQREFAGSRLNGATGWVGPGRPFILLSGRGKRADIIFFTLFHEIGHLLRHGRKETFVTDDEPTRKHADPRENEADDFARTTLLPPPFDDELGSITTAPQVRDLANRAGIAASIVAGRLCREYPAAWPYQKANKLRPSIDIEALGKAQL